MSTLARPNLAEQEPVIDFYHGVEVVDPYRWLEDQDSPRTRAWLDEQVRYSRAYFDGIPGRREIRKRVAEALRIQRTDTPVKVGNRYFFLKREANQEQPCICMREGFDGKDQVLVDPADRGTGPFTSVKIVNVSSDGSLLAIGVRHGGELALAVEIFDVNERRTLPEGLPKGALRGLHFRGAKSYIYSHEPDNPTCRDYRAVFEHQFDKEHRAPVRDRAIFVAGQSPDLRIILRAGKNAEKVAYLVKRSGRKIAYSIYFHDLSKSDAAVLLVDDFKHTADIQIVGDQALLCTDWEAPNRRIVAVPFSEPSLASVRTIVPEAAARIHDWIVAGGKLFVNYVENLASLTRVYDLSGQPLGEVQYPEAGTSRLALLRGDGAEAWCTFESFCRPPCPLLLTGAETRPSPFDVVNMSGSLPEVEATRVEFESKDGTRIPMVILDKRGAVSTGPAPTIITGYGGFGASVTPTFSKLCSVFTARGGRYAVVNMRGGAEFGEAWHKAAQGANRQTAYDDFICAAEWLIAKGLTTPRQLGIAGASNSGLLVGVAITQRPDLFRAALCLAPLLDMLRYDKFGGAHFWGEEYGLPDDPRSFESLYAYSPYHRVRDGVDYPAFLMISGDADKYCDSMHARKFAARLQASSTSGRPVLLDYTSVRGHTPTLPLTFRIEALTDRIAFLFEQLGVEWKGGVQ